MFSATIDDVGFLSTAGKSSDASANFRNHATVNFATDDKFLRFFEGKSGNEAAFIAIIGVNTTNVSQYQKFFSFQCACDFACYAVSVDVVSFAVGAYAGRSNYRDKAVCQQYFNQFGVNMFNIANKTDIYQVNFTIFINVSQMFFSLYEISVFAVQTNSTTT